MGQTLQSVRLGMIGCGLISHAHGRAARALYPQVRFAACASRDADRGAAWAREYGCDHAFIDYREMLARECLDGVVIATRPADHRAHIEACLDAGMRYILCEKALTISREDALAIWCKSQTARAVVMEGFMYRHHPVMDRLVSLLMADVIGAVDNINATFHMFDAEDAADRSWRQQREAGGGVVHDFLCYPVDATNRFAGGLPRRVSATGFISPRFGTVHRLYAWIEYDTGCVAMVESSRKAMFGQRLVITGDTGELSLPQAWTIPGDAALTLSRSAAFIRRHAEILAVPFSQPCDGRLVDYPVFRRQMANFIDVMRQQAKPKIRLAESVVNVLTLAALEQSFRDRAVVDVALPPELLGQLQRCQGGS
ncbi:MAG: Gfo/Idh/MocA family oxidoreductase [Gammaproteobacteria bacterium]|nr:Gfo/Idh/MocA family oxidoreductase [Gammaproteobacteria bacterium]